MKLLQSYFFLDRELLFIYLKRSKEQNIIFEYYVRCFTEVIINQHFLQETSLSCFFLRLQTLVLFFLCFSVFARFNLFLEEQFLLNIYYGSVLLHFGLYGVKIHKIYNKCFFYPPPINLQYEIIHV